MCKKGITGILLTCAILATTVVESRTVGVTMCYAEETPFVIENNVLVSYNGEEEKVVVPDGVLEIGENAFLANKTVKEISLPESVELISDNAFSCCRALEYINIPQGIKEIGAGAFRETALKEIDVPAGVEIGTFAFTECKGLADEEGLIIVNDILFDYAKSPTYESVMKIPDNVKRICSNAFNEDDFDLVLIPDGCEVIEKGAFVVCGIGEIVIPASVTAIDEKAIMYASRKTTVYGYENSVAQEFVRIRNEKDEYSDDVEFRLLGTEGDVNGDGQVSLADANVVLQAALGIKQLKYIESDIANVDGQGDITLADANLSLKLALGIE